MLAPHGDHAFRRLVARTKFPRVPLADCFAQRLNPGGGRVAGAVGGQRLDRGLLDWLRRGEIRLAHAEVDNVEPGSGHPFSLGQYGSGGR